jgi:hypothetical protein
VDKPLTCTLDFGDGSAPEVLENCANKYGTTHTYQEEGVYVAKLKVTGEDRPVTKTLTIDVKNGPPDTLDFSSVLTWKLEYTIQNNSDHSWSEYGITTNRNWTEQENGTAILTRTSNLPDQITLDGEGSASSSLNFKRVDSSQFFTEERWDTGAGPSTVRVSVTLNPESGMYDVYLDPGDFTAQYGGSRTQAGSESTSYGPSDEETHVQPAPVTATGELTRTLPKATLTITGSYTWEDFFAFEQSQDASYDVNEEWKKGHKSGTTSWTLTPLTYEGE